MDDVAKWRVSKLTSALQGIRGDGALLKPFESQVVNTNLYSLEFVW